MDEFFATVEAIGDAIATVSDCETEYRYKKVVYVVIIGLLVNGMRPRNRIPAHPALRSRGPPRSAIDHGRRRLFCCVFQTVLRGARAVALSASSSSSVVNLATTRAMLPGLAVTAASLGALKVRSNAH